MQLLSTVDLNLQAEESRAAQERERQLEEEAPVASAAAQLRQTRESRGQKDCNSSSS